jgi:ankyrin repeat protein
MEVARAGLRNSIEEVRMLVRDLGIDVNQVSCEMFTPVFASALKGNLDVLRCLVTEFGADANTSVGPGKEHTPLHVAAEEGHIDVVLF